MYAIDSSDNARKIYDCIHLAIDRNISELSILFQARYRPDTKIYECALVVEAPRLVQAPWARQRNVARCPPETTITLADRVLGFTDLPESLATGANQAIEDLTKILAANAFTFSFKEPDIVGIRYLETIDKNSRIRFNPIADNE